MLAARTLIYKYDSTVVRYNTTVLNYDDVPGTYLSMEYNARPRKKRELVSSNGHLSTHTISLFIYIWAFSFPLRAEIMSVPKQLGSACAPQLQGCRPPELLAAIDSCAKLFIFIFIFILWRMGKSIAEAPMLRHIDLASRLSSVGEPQHCCRGTW